MKIHMVLALLGSLFAATAQSEPLDWPYSPTSEMYSHPRWHEFSAFLKQYGKAYSLREMPSRFDTFLENINKINSHRHTSFNISLNRFADLTEYEFGKEVAQGCYGEPPRWGFYQTRSPCLPGDGRVYAPLPASIDWRDKNAVTEVKNQGQCGSCWSFSATGAMEGAWAIASTNLVGLSEQQLIDCSVSYGDHGCRGGLMDDAFAYAIDNGMCSESDVPYEGKSETCTKCDPVVLLDGCRDVTPNDETALAAAVAVGPVSVAIEADQKVFQLYSGGIIDAESCGTKLDHGVLVVGYGEDNGQEYWLVKNSWGADWGEKGYFRLAKHADTTGKGTCGVAMQPSYPIVKV